MGTRNGTIKKTELSAFSNPRAGGIIAMGVEETDAVMAVRLSDGSSEVFIGTRQGKAIRFPETDVRSMGRTAYGVRGIQLRDGDEVEVVGVKTRSIDPTVEMRLMRDTPERATLRSGKELPLIVSPVAA